MREESSSFHNISTKNTTTQLPIHLLLSENNYNDTSYSGYSHYYIFWKTSFDKHIYIIVNYDIKHDKYTFPTKLYVLDLQHHVTQLDVETI
jgi:hypothetical protein